MPRIFLTKWFTRFAKREGLDIEALRGAVARAETASIDADLGSGLIKQRVARKGGGRSGGYRTILVFKQGDLAIFVYGFAKSERANLDARELLANKLLARDFLGLDKGQLDALVANAVLTEITDHD